jgi:hypothetical protein
LQWKDFAVEMLENIDNDNIYLNRAMFSDEETLYITVMYIKSMWV